ncbi:MAG: DUF4347 domain-containing protein, partial [Prosthecobacter sp.]|uniref:DUF4347 domain-containing protein n=1 Tax=Prosthecobacter sp. TaxID=1965333 RepID=UPI0039043955
MSLPLPQSKSVARARRHAADAFVLEMMEPRILLSGAPVDLPQPVVALAITPPPDASTDQVVMMIPGSTSLNTEITATPSAILLQSAFGETEALPAATETKSEPLAPENADQSAGHETAQVAAKADEAAVEPPLPAALEAGLDDSKAQPASNAMTGELVETLRAANGPPAATAFSSDVTNSSNSTIYKTSETGAPSGSLSVPAQLIIIDGAVSGFRPLIEGLQSGNSNIQVVVLDTQSNGIQQITELLKNFRNLDAIHILAHGGDGSLRLGNLVLNDSKLAENGQSIASWGAALKSGGDILLYGCEVAQSDKAAQFVSRLAQVTGADIAASTNATGASNLGGDWRLEYQTGAIEAGVPFVAEAMATYSSLLDSLPTLTLSSGDTTTVTVGSTVTVGIGGTNYTNLTVTGTAALNGTLAVSIANGFNLAAGQTFDILTAGSVTGAFTNATGLFNNGSFRLEIVQAADKLQLVVKQVPGNPPGPVGLLINAGIQAAKDALGKLFSDYFTNTPPVTASLDLALSSFVTLSGSFGAQKTGNLITLVAQNATALLSAGGASAGISGANLAVLLNTDGTRVVYGTGNFSITAGSSFVNATGTVTVTQNTTASAASAQTVTVSGVSVNMPAIAAGAESLAGTGLNLGVNGFVTLGGDFGFKQGTNSIEIVANNASALLTTAAASIGVNSATFGLLLPSTGGIALSASGTPVLNLPTTFASVGATSVGVDYNSTGAAINQTLTVSGVSQALSLPTGSIASPYNTVTVTGFTASIADFVTLSGNFGFQRSGTDLLAAATNATARLEAGSTVKAGLTGATVGLIIKADQKFALQTTGGAVSLDLGSGFASASATSINVAYNITGADVNTALSITAGGSTVSANVVVANGANAVSVTGLDATVSNFVRITGDFGMLKNSGDLIIAGSNASAVLESGTMKAGVSGVTLGLIVKPDFTLALQASGAAQLTLGSGFASAAATSASVSYNNTGSNVNRTAAVVIGSTSVSAPVVVNNGVTTVTVTGFLATLVDFVTLSGDFGFQKDSGDLIIAGSNVSARLEVGSTVKVGLNGATVGMIIRSNQKLAFEASGGSVLFNLGSGFSSATAASLNVSYNNTGSDVSTNASVTVGTSTVSAPVNVLNGVTSVSVTGLSAVVSNFVTLSGDFGMKKTSGGDLQVAASNASARLEAGSTVKAGVTGATIGLLVKADQKIALQTTGGSASLLFGSGFASATATSVNVSYNNTGADVNTTASVTIGGTTVSGAINVTNGVTSVAVTGLDATVAEFVTISGDFGVEKTSGGDLEVVGNNVGARLVLAGGLVDVGVTGAKLGLLVKADEKIALQTTGGAMSLNLGNGFATATATSVNVRFNNTGALVNETLSVTVGGTTIDAGVNVANGTTSVVVGGLNAQIAGYVTLSGDMGFKKSASGRLIAAGSNVSATLNAGSVAQVGVTGATVGLIVTPDQKIALQATNGAVSINLGSGFASATATSVGVSYNNTGADVNTTITGLDGVINAPVNVVNGVTSVIVTGLNATVSEFVTVGGDFGVEKTSGGDLEIVGNNAGARLVLAGNLVDVGVTGAMLGLLIKPDQTFAIQTTGGAMSLNLGNGFATATATSVNVRFNNTGALVNQTLSVTTGGTTINAAVNVAYGTTSVVVGGLNAQIGGFVTLSGDMGFKKSASGRLIAAGSNVSATLNAGAVAQVGVTGATVGLIVTPDQKIALQASSGAASINLGSGFATVTATSVGVSYNNTGADVATTITGLDGVISAPVNVTNGVTSVTVTGLSAVVSEFVTVSGDFGVEKTVGGDLEIVGNNASARLMLSGGLVDVGVTGATLGLLVKADQTFALQTTGGSLNLNLGNGFATATASTVNVRFNNTGALVNETLSVTVGGTTINAGINVANGTTSVVVGNLNAQIGGFVTLSGDMGFKKSASGRLIAAGNNISATLNAGAVVQAGVTGATAGLIVTPDQKIAFQTTGGSASLNFGSGFAMATATSVNVSYNNTGADVNTTITGLGGAISAPVNVVDGVTSVVVIGLNAQVANFVTLSGDFGIKKNTGGDLEIAANNAGATLNAGSVVRAGVTGATIGLLVKADQKIALQATGGTASLDFGSGFATATATSVNVSYNNTGADVDTTASATVGGTTVSADVKVLTGVTSVVVIGLNAQIANFVTLSGDFGIKKTTGGDLEIAGNNATARLEAGSVVKAGVTGATLGLLVKADQKIALQTTGGAASLILGSGFASATATSVNVSYNNTGADVNTTASAIVGGTTISADIEVLNGVTSVVVIGLNAQVANFVFLSGDFGIKKTTGGDLEIAGNNATARLEAGSVVKAGVTGATLGLLVKADQKIALQTTGGTASLILGGGFASATATSVNVSYNNTGADVNTTASVTVGGTTVSGAVNVLNGVTSVVVTGLDATVAEFVTLSGDYGIEKTVGGDLEIVGNNASARLVLAGGFVDVGVTGATLGLLIKPDQTFALQTTGGALNLNLGNGFATATASTVNVRFNNTGALVNETLSVTVGGTTINAGVNVANGTTSVVVGNLNAQIGGFVTLSGDMGFKKSASGRLIAAGSNVSATLNAGSVVQAGVTGATVGLIITPDQKIALQATGGTAFLNLGNGFASATATSVGVSYNNTGADVNTTITGLDGVISAPVNVVNGVTSVTVTGLNAVVADFVAVSGDFGIEKTTGGDLEIVGNNASARLVLTGGLINVGVTGATLGLLIKQDQTFALQTTGGALSLNLGNGFATATASTVNVRFNNTGALVNQTLDVTTGGTTISAGINVANGTTSVVLGGLNAQIGGFVTLVGDMGFRKSASGRLIAAGSNVSATLNAGAVVQVGVTGATIGLIITPDQKIAFQATGGTASINLGGGFATVTATGVGVSYNNTGADVNTTITGLDGVINAPVNVLNGVTSVAVTGLNAQIANFVTLSGDFGVKKTVGGDLEVVASNASAALNVGSVVRAGVTGATIGLLVKADEKIALQTTGGSASFNLGSGFASATATSVNVAYNNTGADVNTTVGATVGGIAVTAGIEVDDGTTAVVVTGLSASIADYVTLSGDFGFQKNSNGDLIVASSNASARLEVGSVIKVGVNNATIGLIVLANEKMAFEASGGSAIVSLGSGFASATATSVSVQYNNTGANVNTTATVSVDGTTVNGTINVADGVTAVSVTGLNATISSFVTLTGDYGFKKTSGGDLLVVAQNAGATLNAGTSIQLGVSGATFGMLVKADGKIALQADGAAVLNLGSGIASATATSVTVSYNNTGADVAMTATVGAVSAPINVLNNTTTITATGLNATISQFVTLTGNFGFQKTAGGDINVTANSASATLTAGSLNIGVTSAALGMILKADGKIAMQASGTLAMNLGAGFASVSATSVTVAYNNTGADVNTTLTVGTVAAPINVANNTTAISAVGFLATISEFVTISGNFGFKKTAGGDIVLAATGASAKLTAGSSIEIGVGNATIGLIIQSNGKIALDASGAFAMNLGSSFASASATSVTVKYNNTGADVNTSVTVGAVTATINVANGVTAISTTGFSATIVTFVTITGDFGFKKTTGGDIIVVAQNAAANLTVSGLSVGVTGATLGLIIKPDSKIALQGSGALNFNLGTAFASVSAVSAAIAFNNTGANVNTTVTVGAVSAPIVVDDNTVAVSMIGFEATISNFVTLKGDFGFKKSGSDMAVAVNGASATLTVGSFEVGVTSATLGLLVTAAGKIALQASGAPRLVLPGNFSAISATSVTVSYNNTGADVNTTVIIGSVTAPIVVTNNTTSISVTGFEASLLDFVTVKGDFGFQKNGNDMIIAASGASATLKVGTTEVGVSNATLGLIIKDGGGTILQASGAPRLVLPGDFATVTATSVSVAYNNTADAVNTTLNVGGVSATVNVAANTTAVTVTGLNATITNFVTITGNFGFKKSGSDIVTIATNASAIMSAAGFSVGLTSASLALLLKSDGSFALQASGTPVLTIPVDMSSVLSLSITTLSVAYNTTGTAIDTTLTVGALSAPLKVSSGTKVNPYLSIGGSASVTIAGFITLTGDFGFTKTTDSATDTTKIKIGAANVTGLGDGDKYSLTDGTLGLVLFRKTSNSTSLGYAMEASTTGRLAASILSAEATVTLRRNTTTFAVNELVPVLTRQVPVVFSATEVAKNGTPFNTVAVSDAIIKIGDITIKGSYASQPNGPNGESITTITNASLEFGDPVLFKITAASVTYKSFSTSVTLGGVTYADGVQQVIITGGEILLGDAVILSGSFNITRSKTPGTALTNVAFSDLGVSLKLGGRVMVTIAGDGSFHYGGANGFKLDSFVPTTFDILPDRQPGYTPPAPPAPPAPGAPPAAPPAATTPKSPPKTIKLGPLTLTNPSVKLTDFGVGFGSGANSGKIALKLEVSVGVETASLAGPGGTGASVSDGTDADKFGIAGIFTMDLFIDPANGFAPSGADLGSFSLEIDQFELNLGSFLVLKANGFEFNPDAAANEAMFSFTSLEVLVKAGPIAIGGGASNFSIMGDGSFVAGPNFAITLAVGDADAASTLKTPAWMPLKSLRVTLKWEGSNFNTDPSKFLIVVDAQVASLQGMSGLSISGGVTGLTIDVALLAAGEFPIIGIDSFNVGVSGNAFGGQVKGALVMGVVKLDADYNIIPSGSNTAVARRFFYGGIQGAITIAGLGSVEMRMGFSDFGPLSFFISAGIPIILDPQSGLAITDLRGGFDFGAALEDPTVYELDSNGQQVIDPTTGVAKIDAKASAFALRPLAQANTPTTTTPAQWETMLKQQIATIIKNAGGSSVSFSDLAKNMVIHAGATLYDAYASKQTFRAEVDLAIDITGKILLTGKVIFADNITMDGYFYADLSKVASGSGRFLFLFDSPGMPNRDNGGISYYGLLDFGLVDSTGKRLAAAELEDKYYIVKTTRDTFTWSSSTSRTLVLDRTPITTGATFTVTVGSLHLAPSGYTLTNGNTITLTNAPADGESIAVDYSYKDVYGLDANGDPIANPNSTVPTPDGFQILIAGGARLDLFNNSLFVQFSGQVTLTFTSTEFTVDVEATMETSLLGVIGVAAGRLTVRYGGGFAIYGAVKIATGDGLRKLEDYGIKIQAQLTITINTTSTEKDVDLRLPATKRAFTTDNFTLAAGDFPTLYMSHSLQDGGHLTVTEDGTTTLVEGVDYAFDVYNSAVTLLSGTSSGRSITLAYDSKDYLALHLKAAPQSLNIVASALAVFSIGGTEFFRMQGGLSMTIGSQGFSLILVGKLMVGPAGSPFLTFNATALVFAGVYDGTLGFAAMFQASLNANLGPFAIQGDFLVQVNTFGKAVVFDIPNVNPAFPTIRDENGQTIEKTRQDVVILRNADGSPQLDANGNVMTAPVTLRTVSISGGAPRLLGGFEDDAPYFVLRGKGSMDLITSKLGGQIYISLTPSKFHINMSGEITAAGNSFLAAGDFNLVYGAGTFYVFGGVLAKRKQGSGDPLESFGISVSGAGVILLNTDTVSHRVTLITPAIAGNPGTPAGVQEIDVNPGFVFKASVVASFRIVGGMELFRIEGTLIMEISTGPVGFKLLIQGSMKLGPDSHPLLTFNANAVIYAGQLKSGAVGFAAMIHVGLDASAIPGVTLSGGFVFITNTFSEDVTFDIGEKDDPNFQVPTIVDEKGNSIETERNTFKQAVDSNGALRFDANGDPIWELDGNGDKIPKIYRQVIVTGGAPNLTGGFESPAPYVFIRGFGEVSIFGAFKFSGGFGILLTPTKFQLSVNASLSLGPFGSLQGNGFMELSANGVIGAFSLSVGSGGFGSLIGLEFSATYMFAVNTIGETRTVVFLDGSTLVVNPGVRVKVDGTITFIKLLDAEAHVDIQFSGNAWRMDGYAALNLAGGLINQSIELHVSVSDKGFVLVTEMNSRTNLGGVIKISATGKLYINTGSEDLMFTLANGSQVKVFANSVYFKLSGQMVVLEIFKMSITITAQVGGEFIKPGTDPLDPRTPPIRLAKGDWAFSFSSSTSFFFFGGVSVSGYIMSNGSFSVDMSGGISVGNGFFGFSAGVSAHIGYDADSGAFSFGASAHGSMHIVGIGFGFSAGFGYNSATGRITVRGSITLDFWLFSITFSATFTVGYLEKPVPAYLATDSNGRRLADGSGAGPSGKLYLTTGDGPTRNYRKGDNDATYSVSHVSTQADGTETVLVTYLGRSAEYYGVREIIMNGDDGNETLYVHDGVVSPLTINGGGGDDEFYIDGGSTNVANIINGGGGNDYVNIGATNGNIRYVISGGSGINTLTGGIGNDTIYAGPDVDYITGNLGADTIYTGTGKAYILGDLGVIRVAQGSSFPAVINSGQQLPRAPGDPDDTFDFNYNSGAADTIYAKTGTNYIFGGAGNDRIYGGGTNHVVGDNGYMQFDAQGKVTKIAAEGTAGGDDYIDSAGASTVNVMLGGSGADTILGGSASDVALGDNGFATFYSSGKLSGITSVAGADFNDILNLGDGINVAFGGSGNDNIGGGKDQDIFGGDNGSASFDTNGTLISFTDPGTGGDDILTAGAGNNVLIGGGGNDTINGAEGHDIIIGDEGTANFNSGGFLINITTINHSNGGNDILGGGDGNNVILGGFGADTITLGVGYSVVIGDNGSATMSNVGVLGTITTLDPSIGAADTITGANGNNVIFGGAGADIINVNDLGDVILGDHGSAIFNAAGLLLSLTSSNPNDGDADLITTGIGSNVIIGGVGADQITAGIGNNIILGDSGQASFNAVGGKSILASVATTDFDIGAADRIISGNGKNIVFGGAGADNLSSGAGFSILAGDNASALFDATGLLVSIQTEQPTVGNGDTIRSTDGRTIVLGGAGVDDIATGRGDDVILGDHGKATFVTSGTTPSSIGTIVFSNDGILTTITTTQPEIGANDIVTGSDGFNVIVGGLGADQITGGANRDIVIGDNGRANFDNTGVLVLIESTDAALGGDSIDNIIVGNGPDIVIGGNGADNIQAAGDISDDIVIGDNGKATFDSTNGVSVLRDIISTDPDLGDNDTINTGDGYNIVIGGFGTDGITGGAHTDVILGDNGHAVFNADGVLTFITTTSPAIGNGDIITFGAGGNTVFGGAGSDTLTGLEGTDVIVGDNGNATFTDAGLLTFITTSDVTIGAADIISTGAGFNTVLGGFGKDNITGGVNTDVIIGDHGNATFDPASGESIIRDIISTETTDGDDDIITVGDGFNVIIGGFGADQVNGGAGDDVILGDNGHAVFNATGILTYITTIEPTVGGNDIIMVGDGNNTVLSGFGADEITGGVDGDVVIGDHGNATFTDAGILTFITTTQPGIGGDDIIKVADGFNVILAGFGADQVTGGDDRDVVLGDNGNATFTTAGILTYITTTEPTIGNDDIIKTGDGDNIVIGGFGADQVTGGDDRDIVLGDNGNATFTTAGILTFITTTEPTIGNDDIIKTGDGDNIVIGGFGADQVTGGADRDVVLGDNGNATFTTAGILTYITTTEPTIGNDDVIKTGDGDNIVIGGFGKDEITGGDGRDVVLGDNGNASFDTTGVLTFITTSDPSIGSDDVIVTGNGFNVIFAGIGADRVTGGTGRDVVLGDNGNATFDSTGGQSILRDIISTETDIGGADIIDGGTGNNIILGGTANDTITTGGGDDIVLGDSGHAVFNAVEILTYITTITPTIGGDDIINVGDGFNIVFGGFGKDNITGGDGVDLVLGDNGYATFNDLGALTYLTTTDHTIGDDDRIFTNGGDDLIFGGTANDYIDSGSGDDTVFGDFGYFSLEKLNDPYVFHPRGADVLEEETGGNDTIFGGSGKDYILGEGGDDTIDGQAGDDSIFAGYGSDILHGGDDNDMMLGGPGGDVFDS